jgi:hypothetical protein
MMRRGRKLVIQLVAYDGDDGNTAFDHPWSIVDGDRAVVGGCGEDTIDSAFARAREALMKEMIRRAT